ncbi:hypothetical protein [Microbacterium azadirachtae]|uniref:Uncharacterized protein n=1 Tax=Microbacterium azadirachtae TaxID=582680 RepID=A0A0F0LT74_9MICO|nr:hypothetical protein [Microbacterium azadirachtae]KJL35460.1 hypothetical protein RS86_00456 [Microbacterium azadirachtae]
MTSVDDKTTEKKARKARAKAALPGTIAADSRIDIQSEPEGHTVFTNQNPKKAPSGRRLVDLADVFGGDDLAQMPVIVRETSIGNRVRVWRAPDGSWHRRGGGVLLKMRKGTRSFVITTYKGANEKDLLNLIGVVEDVAEGKKRKHWEKVDEAWADDRTFKLVFNSRRYADPFDHADPSPRVFFCSESRCIERWHTDESTFHTLDHVEKEVGKYASYVIEVNKNALEANSSWFVDLVTTEFSEATPTQVASLVNDLQWAAEECRRANNLVEVAA